jgi:NAD(P)-dependent dehydrogenase (short-subunit alcohol dehydrogenase family)
MAERSNQSPDAAGSRTRPLGEQFVNKVALVAGGTGDLGRAVSLAFADQLAKTVVTFRHQQEFLALEEAAGAGSTLIEGHELDVTDDSAVAGLISTIVAQHGRLDVLVNAVGGYAGGKALWELEPRIFDQMLALNLRSGYLLARAVAPVMIRQRDGVIVNVASRSAVDHAAGAAAYAASKAAAVAMMDSLAADLKGTGVRVNSILPSIIDTEANRKAMPQADFASWPKPQDIARVILFLCSHDAKLIHGAAIPVYGSS